VNRPHQRALAVGILVDAAGHDDHLAAAGDVLERAVQAEENGLARSSSTAAIVAVRPLERRRLLA
jgi:hypothetical protein